MAITVSYDLKTDDSNDHNYVRSMFERFGWKRMGGSVFRYETIVGEDGEDWLNNVVPALMILRSYVLAKGITIRFFTLDTNSVARIDHTDPEMLMGYAPLSGDDTLLYTPTNVQSSETRIRRAMNLTIDLFKTPDDAAATTNSN